MQEQFYYVYVLTNKNHTVLYTGMTNNLKRRINEHCQGVKVSFTKRYNVHVLAYYELTPSREVAIAREKQIKSGSRQKKLDLINSMNPDWEDLAVHL